MLALSDKDFKVAIKKCFSEQLCICLKQIKKKETKQKEIKSLSKETEDIKKKQMAIFECREQRKQM